MGGWATPASPLTVIPQRDEDGAFGRCISLLLVTRRAAITSAGLILISGAGRLRRRQACRFTPMRCLAARLVTVRVFGAAEPALSSSRVGAKTALAGAGARSSRQSTGEAAVLTGRGCGRPYKGPFHCSGGIETPGPRTEGRANRAGRRQRAVSGRFGCSRRKAVELSQGDKMGHCERGAQSPRRRPRIKCPARLTWPTPPSTKRPSQTPNLLPAARSIRRYQRSSASQSLYSRSGR